MPLLMSIDGIQNDSAIPGHEGWLLLNGFEWGGRRAIAKNRTPDGRIRGLVGAPQLRAVKVTRESDFVSPEIWNLLLSKTKKTVSFSWLRTGSAGAELEPYMKMKLDQALITSMAESSSYAEPDETIVFTYERVTLTVVNVGDSLSGAQDVVSYDIQKAKT
jgi:type VI secretion system Hcp family effector